MDVSFTAGLGLMLQSAVSLAEPATATVRIIRPVMIRVEDDSEINVVVSELDPQPQTVRDAAGTLWIEFS